MSGLPDGFVVDSGLPDGFVVDAPTSAPTQPSRSFSENLRRQAMLQLVRPPLEVAGGLVNMIPDAAVASRNVLGNAANKVLGRPATPNYDLPGDQFRAILDQHLPKPENTIEKVLNFAQNVALGSRVPLNASVKNPAPAQFVRPENVRMQTLRKSQDAGYVVPPATTNPSAWNRLMESWGGKVGTAQDAASKNMPVTNSLARKALGLADDVDITKDTLGGIRNQAGDVYRQIRGAGSIASTPKFKAALDSIEEPFKSAAKDFPSLADDTVQKVIGGLRRDSFDAASGVDAIARVRELSQKAYASGDKSAGKALRGAANALEDVIEENLTSRGGPWKSVLDDFRSARQLIAKTYSVEKALNNSTGNVSAISLGQQLSKGKPLSGELEVAARFGQAFPRAAKEILDSGSVRNTDVIAGGLASIAAKDPWLLSYPFLRQAARQALLSKPGQAMATPGNFNGIPEWMLMGATSAAQK